MRLIARDACDNMASSSSASTAWRHSRRLTIDHPARGGTDSDEPGDCGFSTAELSIIVNARFDGSCNGRYTDCQCTYRAFRVSVVDGRYTDRRPRGNWKRRRCKLRVSRSTTFIARNGSTATDLWCRISALFGSCQPGGEPESTRICTSCCHLSRDLIRWTRRLPPGIKDGSAGNHSTRWRSGYSSPYSQYGGVRFDSRQRLLGILGANQVSGSTNWYPIITLATSTSVSTWMGDRRGRPSAVNLCPFVGVDLYMWPTVYLAVIVLTPGGVKWIKPNVGGYGIVPVEC